MHLKTVIFLHYEMFDSLNQLLIMGNLNFSDIKFRKLNGVYSVEMYS